MAPGLPPSFTKFKNKASWALSMKEIISQLYFWKTAFYSHLEKIWCNTKQSKITEKKNHNFDSWSHSSFIEIVIIHWWLPFVLSSSTSDYLIIRILNFLGVNETNFHMIIIFFLFYQLKFALQPEEIFLRVSTYSIKNLIWLFFFLCEKFLQDSLHIHQKMFPFFMKVLIGFMNICT